LRKCAIRLFKKGDGSQLFAETAGDTPRPSCLCVANCR